MVNKLRYIDVYYRTPERFSNICRTTLINLPLFWYAITPTAYPFPSSLPFLKHFSQG